MQARTGKLIGVMAASTAILFAGTTVTAHADEPTTAPAAPIPNPEGPACDATVKAVPSGPGSLLGLSTAVSSTALASIPEIATFSSAVSGGLNPEVNVAAVLDNGPYVVFAPTDEAFAKLAPEELETLKTDPAALTSLVYYHMVLGILGPDVIQGTMYTQQGKPIVVKGKGGDITVNGDTKVVCAGIKSENMRIYLIDTVLDPNQAPSGIGSTATTTSATEAPEATTESSEPAETSVAAEATETSGAAETESPTTTAAVTPAG